MLDSRIILTACLCLLCFVVHAQAIDNTASFRTIDTEKYVRFNYENDYFSSTDYYYTQGINVEIVDPVYKKFLFSRGLLNSRQGKIQYGISIEHNGYTPTSISHPEILHGDRPFAATLMLKSFSINNRPDRHLRITSSLSLGMIGPVAGGYQMQETIHRWIHGVVPRGWSHQIQNDLIINYEAGAEKNLLSLNDHVLVNGFVNGRLGTLSDKVSTGFVIMLGSLNPGITSVFGKGSARRKRNSVYVYAQPMINAVAYDATLQGGLFNRESPYTIASYAVEAVTFQGNYGLVMNIRSVYLEYSQSVISKEFNSGMNHRWGGVRIGIKF